MAPDMQYPIALPPGFRLDEYRIERFLGSGGFGITYSAIDENLDLRVAVKEYLPKAFALRGPEYQVTVAMAQDEAVFRWGLERFLDEARTLARFDHTNIVKVKRFLEANGTGYIVMEYLDGEPLAELLKRQTKLSEAKIREHVLPLSDGLAEVHAAGLLHRDIKPGNIMVRASGIPVLIDFGSARQAVNSKSRKLTAVVTDGYAPLEQYSEDANSQGEATDIYALGAVLYRCVTGATPGNAPGRALDDRLITATEAAGNGYSEGLLTAINEALAIRSQNRPSDIAAFLELVSLDATEAIAAYLKLLDLDRTEAKGAFDRGDYEPVFNGFRALAELGFATAQHYLGIMYYHGRGITQDRDQAVRWVTRAAERGHLMAQEALGHWYANGENVAKDRDQAVHWYTRAARQGSDSARQKSEFFRMVSRAEAGSAYAQHELGTMYREGKGTRMDAAQAEEWFTRAAQQGHAGALFSLGKLYYWGDQGVPDDIARGIQLIIKSAESGYHQAQFDLGKIYQGKYLRGNENEELALKWLARAADSRDPVAQTHLGSSLYHGRGVPRDRARGLKYLTMAAEYGHADAEYELGHISFGGERAPEENARSVQWYCRAAERGHVAAQSKLAHMYASNGLFSGQLEFAFMRARYVGVPEDEAQAVFWTYRLAERGSTKAQNNLAYLYNSGRGVQVDDVRAYAWAELASNERLRDTIAQRLSQEQLAKAEQLVSELRDQVETSH